MLKTSPMGIVDVTNYPAIEIDFPKDLNTAKDMFWWQVEDWNQGVRRHAEMDVASCIELLLDVKEVFAKYEIDWFFCFGLALGSYRDKKLILWDSDLDIGCYLKDRGKVLKAEQELLDRGCYIPTETNYHYDRWYIKNREKVELHFFEKLGDERVYDIFRCKPLPKNS